jgi:virginiamycin B lyase
MNKSALVAIVAFFVIAFSAASSAQQAALTEYPLPADGGAPAGITQGPDGAMWFTEETFGVNNIGRITSSGAITEYAAPNGVLGFGIAAGSDGALWFTEDQNNSIGRMTTDGVITNQFQVSGEPTTIIAGPDGALWFVEFEGSTLTYMIGRMTTAGVVTSEYPVSASPGGMTVGPDDAIWFGDGANQVGRITTSGSLSEYSVPTGSSPYEIAVGSDGALWFTESDPNNGNAIGRMTTDGVVTNIYSLVPYGLEQPEGICLGPDGAIWFTAANTLNGGANHFGRITTSGVITVYTIPNASATYSIAAGADGAVWLTDFGGDAIGRVALNSAPPATTLTVKNVGSPNPVQANQNLTYTITITNTGPADATGVELMDPLIAGRYTLVSVTPSQGGCTVASTVVCTLGNLANGAIATVAIVVTQIIADAPNTATVTANETGQVPYTLSATTNPTVKNPFAVLSLSMTGSPNPVSQGATLTYSITVNNAGPLDATNVILTDQFPSGQADAIAEIPSQGTCTDATQCLLGTLPAGNVATVSISAVPTTVGTLTNSATVRSGEQNTGRPRATANTTVVASAGFTPVGTGVTVQPTDSTTGNSPVTITFSGVSTPGSTSLMSSSSGPTPPAGFSLGSPATYYYLATTSIFTPPATVCFNYAGISFAGAPQLFHFESGAWVNVTVSVDTVNQIICGSVTSFSPFAIFQPQCVTPPSLSVSLSPNTLWPPNNKLVPIRASVIATDVCDPNPSVSLVSITANEALAPGDISGATCGTDDLSFELAATRSGSGNGRIYTVTYGVTDHLGHTAAASATVTVPHDQGKN